MTQFYSGMKGPVAIAKLNELWEAADTVITGAANTAVDAAAAGAAAAAATTAYDNFDDRYLGQKQAPPTLDNDGNALLVGALYFNTTDSSMYVRTATNTWVSVSNTASSVASENSAIAAAGSASTASTQATNAEASATAAAASASTASTQATNAEARATAAAASASTASTQATNAEASATAAANIYDLFDDRYLGAKAQAPTLDNDNNTLVSGALYFNTTDNSMYVRSSSNTWVSVSNTATSIAAGISAAEAEASNISAEAYKNLAQDWAEKMTEVEVGKYSAKYWAGQAAASITGSLIYRGAWSAASGVYPAGTLGDYYKVSTAGTVSSVPYEVNDSIIYNGTTWDKIDSTDAVTSVAGKVGVVTLDKSDVGLSNVDNTSDMDKPISTAVAAALQSIDPIVFAIALG